MGCACLAGVPPGRHGHRRARRRAPGVQLVPPGSEREREERVEVVPVAGQLAVEEQCGLPVGEPRSSPGLVGVDLAPHVSERG